MKVTQIYFFFSIVLIGFLSCDKQNIEPMNNEMEILEQNEPTEVVVELSDDPDDDDLRNSQYSLLVYTSSNYGGRKSSIKEDGVTKSGNFTDRVKNRISSIRIRNGCKVWLHTERDQRGESYDYVGYEYPECDKSKGHKLTGVINNNAESYSMWCPCFL